MDKATYDKLTALVEEALQCVREIDRQLHLVTASIENNKG